MHVKLVNHDPSPLEITITGTPDDAQPIILTPGADYEIANDDALQLALKTRPLATAPLPAQADGPAPSRPLWERTDMGATPAVSLLCGCTRRTDDGIVKERVAYVESQTYRADGDPVWTRHWTLHALSHIVGDSIRTQETKDFPTLKEATEDTYQTFTKAVSRRRRHDKATHDDQQRAAQMRQQHLAEITDFMPQPVA